MKQLILFLICTLFHICLNQRQDFCNLPKDEGTGPNYYIRLYYDKNEDKCLPFKFAGEGGNANRFITDKMCMRNCSQKSDHLYPWDETQVCHFSKDTGHCLSHYLLWYYDSTEGICKKFHYSGCGGNGNRFIDAQKCNDTCYGIHDKGGNGEIDFDTDSPAGLVIGIVLAVIGAFILIAVIVIAIRSRTTKRASKDIQGNELPLQSQNVELSESA